MQDNTRPGAQEDSRIPVTLVTGASGSGKTAWISAQLCQPGHADTLVVLDPASGAGLSHPLVAYVREPVTTVPDGGCLCCSLRQDLVRTLINATWRYSRQGKRLYSRAIIESTADASPAAIAAVLTELPALAQRYRLASITALVDAEAGLAAWFKQSMAAEQWAQADRLVLTKTKTLSGAQLEALQLRLREHNPGARLMVASPVYSSSHA